MPADAFKMCLQMVLKVEFDVLMSFRRLERWHDEQAGSQARDDKDSNDDKEGDDGDHEMKSGHGAEMLETIRKSLPRTKRLLWNEVSGSLMTVAAVDQTGPRGVVCGGIDVGAGLSARRARPFRATTRRDSRAILSHQSVRFFKGHHINCIEALLTVLERETYGEVDIVLPWTSGEEQARQTQVSTSAAVDLDDCVARSSNPWDDRGDRGDPGDGYDHIGGDEGPGPSAPPTHHFDIKAAFRDHNITLGDGRQVSTTNSFWRLVKWIMEYVSLMHDLPSAAPAIAAGLVELVSIYLLHIYASFMGAKHGCMEPMVRVQAPGRVCVDRRWAGPGRHRHLRPGRRGLVPRLAPRVAPPRRPGVRGFGIRNGNANANGILVDGSPPGRPRLARKVLQELLGETRRGPIRVQLWQSLRPHRACRLGQNHGAARQPPPTAVRLAHRRRRRQHVTDESERGHAGP